MVVSARKQVSQCLFNDTYDLTSSAASGCRSRQETAVLSGREVFLLYSCVRLYSMDRPACKEGIIETRTGDNGGKWGWPPTRTEIPMSFSGK